jgi:hydrogenase assembly chaperone HypC/HupF
MCISYPGHVVAVDADGATVRTEGRLRRASTLVVPDVRAGDWVTVAAGTIVDRLDPAEAHEIDRLLRTAEARSTGRAGADAPHPPNRNQPRRP